ncbi:MAG: hypothetical protein GC147_07645 [Porphyrobacter sp.]|nr:hypothetical protein [Porphyrobacter sp.]
MSRLALPYVDRIWHASGTLELDEALSPQDAFARLDPLLRAPGTSYAVAGDTLTYSKTNPAAQDKLATFTSGTLRIENQPNGIARLVFRVRSTALLLCFLAPLLFLGFAQVGAAINAWEASAEAADKDKSADKDKDKNRPKAALHPIDKFLGAPAPEDPDAKKKDKADKKEKIPTTPAYVLAGLFLVIWMVGRALEPWLLKRALRAALAAPAGAIGSDAAPAAGQGPGPQPETC